MTRAITRWLCVWTIVVHAAAALAPAIAGPVPAPVIQHTCPAPVVHHRIACPDPASTARGAPWKCRTITITDQCAEEYR